jgi:hypothetical protein
MRPEGVYKIREENVHLTRRYLFVPSAKTAFARRCVHPTLEHKQDLWNAPPTLFTDRKRTASGAD